MNSRVLRVMDRMVFIPILAILAIVWIAVAFLPVAVFVIFISVLTGVRIVREMAGLLLFWPFALIRKGLWPQGRGRVPVEP